jgi:protein-S-isoprenylcysteine O-methyltransferase Ste14
MVCLGSIEIIIKVLGGIYALITLLFIFWGIWRGLHRPLDLTIISVLPIFRSLLFYIITSVLYFGFCFLIWHPLPLKISVFAHYVFFCIGGLLYFLGLTFVLWGRLTLGTFYNVSSSFGAPLFTNHQLITRGPYSLIRHPMYMGIFITGIGGIFLYRTWTLLFITLNMLGLIIRARREEQALGKEFGEQWQEYCRRVPAFFPRIRLQLIIKEK